jgi:hypothetical protein
VSRGGGRSAGATGGGLFWVAAAWLEAARASLPLLSSPSTSLSTPQAEAKPAAAPAPAAPAAKKEKTGWRKYWTEDKVTLVLFAFWMALCATLKKD